MMQRARWRPHLGASPGETFSPRSQETAGKSYREYLIRKISDYTGGLKPPVFFTKTQLAILGPVPLDWTQTLLEHVRDLANDIERIARTSSNIFLTENQSVARHIGKARDWMQRNESYPHAATVLDVQDAIRDCQMYMRRRWSEKRAKKMEAEKQRQDRKVRKERHKAMAELLWIIRLSISGSSAEAMDTWEEIEELIHVCQGSFTEEEETLLQGEFEGLWKRVQTSHRMGFRFWTRKPRPEAKLALLSVTWQLPADGYYDQKTGNITYRSRRPDSDFYSGEEGEAYPWRPDLRVSPMADKVFPIDPLKFRLVSATLNGLGSQYGAMIDLDAMSTTDNERRLSLAHHRREPAPTETAQSSLATSEEL